MVRGHAVAGAEAVTFALAPGVAVTRVELDGAPAATTAHGEGVWSAPATLSTDQAHRVAIAYEGRLDEAFMRDEGGHAWYELQILTRWRPVFAIRGLFDHRSTSRVTLTLPPTFAAASSFGLVEDARTAASARYVWDTGETQCLDFSVAVAEALQAEGDAGSVRLRALSEYGAPCSPAALLEVGCDTVRRYADAWGPCPYPHLTVACLPHSAAGNCGREGLVLAGDLKADPRTDVYATAVAAHELSHMWWGLGVRFNEQRSLGYLEALASYSAERMIRDRFGEEASRERRAGVLLPNARKAEAAAGVSLLACRQDTPESWRLREAKGGCVMLLLERLIGREQIDAALARLLAEFRGKQAEPADVRRAFVGVGGNQVDRFFDDYFDGTVSLPPEPQRYGE